MSGVFLSYRDGDGAYCALVDQALSRTVGSRNVFRDSKSIIPGEDYGIILHDHLSRCDAMIAIVGPHWLGTKGDHRLIDDPHDWVRRELQGAIEREIPLIPVIVDGGHRLADVDLPDDIRSLAGKQDLELRHRHLDVDTARLVDAVRKHLPDLILSLDFEDSAETRERVYRAVRQAFGDLDGWDLHDDGGGGALIRVPATIRPARMVGVWCEQLQEALRDDGEHRVRIGVHTGGTDADLDVARQLGRSDVAKDLARAAPAARVVLVVSDRVYQTVVRNGGRKVEPDFYRGVRIADTPAWATVPGKTVPPTIRRTRAQDIRGGTGVEVIGDHNNVINAGRDVYFGQTANHGRAGRER